MGGGAFHDCQEDENVVGLFSAVDSVLTEIQCTKIERLNDDLKEDVMKLGDALASVKLVLDWCYQVTNISDVFVSDM